MRNLGRILWKNEGRERFSLFSKWFFTFLCSYSNFHEMFENSWISAFMDIEMKNMYSLFHAQHFNIERLKVVCRLSWPQREQLWPWLDDLDWQTNACCCLKMRKCFKMRKLQVQALRSEELFSIPTKSLTRSTPIYF